MNSIQIPTFEYTLYSLKCCIKTLKNKGKLSGEEKRYAKKLVREIFDFSEELTRGDNVIADDMLLNER